MPVVPRSVLWWMKGEKIEEEGQRPRERGRGGGERKRIEGGERGREEKEETGRKGGVGVNDGARDGDEESETRARTLIHK